MRTAFAAAVALLAMSVTNRVMADETKLELGKKVFTELAQPGCPVCHVLADAEANGQVGPSLDSMKPDAERVETAVTEGIGAMPAFEDLTPEQIEAVAAYVSTVAGQPQ